jgi:hypothetical protein
MVFENAAFQAGKKVSKRTIIKINFEEPLSILF